ncbi:MAG: hypothetical protein RIQ63_1385 [Actinomycetota bacterium]
MARGRLLEPEVDDSSLALHTTLRQLFLDRAEPTERLADGVPRHEPAESLTCGDQALVTQHLECATDGDATDLELTRQLRLTRQQSATGEIALDDAGANRLGDVVISDAAHLYYTCIQSRRTQAHI